MDLYFLRHGVAKAHTADPAEDDKRPLTAEGVAKMEAEATRLKQLGVKLDVLVTSPLTRAKQTAKIVGRRLGVALVEDDALRPGFDMAAATQIAARYPAAKAIMLVGHEPDFSATVGALIGGGRVEMKKGGVARLEAEWISEGVLGATLVWLLAPKVMWER